MASGEARPISPDDLEHAVRSVARIFGAQEVVIVGSQALLVGRSDIDRRLRMSVEIDAYPANLHEWQELHPGEEASEVINALLGEGSDFHREFDFFVDGVDDTTAKLSPDWRDRAVRRTIRVDDGTVEAIAPEPNDLVAAKLARGEPKDVQFARICLISGLVKHDEVRKRLEVIMAEDLLGAALGRLSQARHGPRPQGFGMGF